MIEAGGRAKDGWRASSAGFAMPFLLLSFLALIAFFLVPAHPCPDCEACWFSGPTAWPRLGAHKIHTGCDR
jgi:hypothetical protein